MPARAGDAPGFDAAGWAQPVAVPAPLPAEALCPEVGGPVRPVRLLPAVKVYRSLKNEWIVDFGQVVTGRTRVAAQLPAVAVLTLEHFEATEPDGSYHNSVQSAMGVTEQKDTFNFRRRGAYPTRLSSPSTASAMCGVTGLDEPNPAQFTAVVLTSDKADAGTFACSDARLNRLYENTRWSQRGNTLSIPTDCPQREKAGWTRRHRAVRPHDAAQRGRHQLFDPVAAQPGLRPAGQRLGALHGAGHLDLPLQRPADGQTDRLRRAGVLGGLGRRGHRGALGDVRDHRQHRDFESPVCEHEGLGGLHFETAARSMRRAPHCRTRWRKPCGTPASSLASG